MVLNDVVRARIDKRTKEEAEAVLAAIGLTVSDAFRLLLIKVAREGALPFDPLIPNEETIAAMREARAGKTIKAGSVDQLLTVLNAEDRDHQEIQEGLQAHKRGAARRSSR
jgi:DNA-damage-inducible protein J